MGIIDDAGSFGATVVRLGRGIYPRMTADKRVALKHTLELYDYEGCPFCRKVREALSELDLDYIARPVAHGSPRRELLKKLGGKVQVPYLVDPNTGTRMYESNDIVAYLDATYGGERRWGLPIPGFLNDINSGVASAVRLARGTRCRAVREGKKKVRPLTLYNMEGSPYCRKVREVLTELDLEHVVCNVPKGSPKRADLEKRGGKVQVPYLIDPNTTREMYESDDIIAYLEKEYGG